MLLRIAMSCAVVFFSACGTVTRSSGPLPLGPDTWRISVKDGIKGTGSSQSLAIQEATAHCSGMGKNIMVTGTREMSDKLTGEITYRCLKTGDPDLVRPELQKVPDTLIKVEK